MHVGQLYNPVNRRLLSMNGTDFLFHNKLKANLGVVHPK